VYKNYTADYKFFQEHQQKSRRFPVFPGGISNSRRFPVFPGHPLVTGQCPGRLPTEMCRGIVIDGKCAVAKYLRGNCLSEK